MKAYLVIRFSAMGDVLLTLPVLAETLRQNPDIRFVLLTRPKFAAFFEGYDRIEVFKADVDKEYKGFFGLWRLSRFLLENYDFSAVLDLHEHLRTKVLKRLLFRVPAFTLDKGRADKKALIRKENKMRKALPHATERYAEVLRMAGILVNSFQFPNSGNADLSTQSRTSNLESRTSNLEPQISNLESRTSNLESRTSNLEPRTSNLEPRTSNLEPRTSNLEPPINYFKNLPKIPFPKNEKWIGIAPFAQHKGKIWPLEKVEKLILKIPKEYNILLFGGGKNEVDLLSKLAKNRPNVLLIAGKYSMKEELAFISSLDVMLCMDSSNMHLAALAGVKTHSIWGATHSDAGFSPFGSQAHKIIEISTEELACRPCSVYGNKPCFRGDYACLEWIGVDEVLKGLTT